MVHIFIVNNLTTEKGFSEQLKKHLTERGDIRFFIFNTSNPGMEADIANKMIRFLEGEEIRFYCCGGSGTFRNVLNEVINYKDFEMAFYPCGATNDFLKVFGEDKSYFEDIDNLIDGKTKYIDYIKTNYGVALNTASYGMDTDLCITLERVEALDIFGSKIPNLIAYAKAILGAKRRRLYLTIDREMYTEDVKEIIIANGCTFGGNMYVTDTPSITDGYLDYIISNTKYRSSVFRVMLMMVKKNFQGVREATDSGLASHFEVKAVDGRDICFNLDGEIVNGGNTWKIEVVKKGLKFIIPREVQEY